jgi:hypothetical protein
MNQFSEIADQLEGRWRAVGYDNQVFPALAAEALAAANLPEQVSVWDELRQIAAARELTEQRDLGASFSNLPITLANRPRFYVDLYLWLDGTTSIHQHSFSGAFQVLEGSSLHSRYRFEERKRINEHFRIGDINLEAVELLVQGDIREIVSGARFAHSLFHLARPSATITVRTVQDVTALPQFDYLPPSIAINPFFSEPLMTRKVQIAAFFLDAGRDDADQMVTGMLRDSDPQTAFRILSEVNQRFRRASLEQHFTPGATQARFKTLLSAARERHGDLIEDFSLVFKHQNRTAEIIRRRAQVTSDDHRYFLALLLNLADRNRIFELLTVRYPGTDAAEQICEWVGELGRTRVWGSQEPNVLGLSDFDEDYHFIFELLLAGKTLEEIKEQLTGDQPADQGAEVQAKVSTRVDELRRSPLLQNLFLK